MAATAEIAIHTNSRVWGVVEYSEETTVCFTRNNLTTLLVKDIYLYVSNLWTLMHLSAWDMSVSEDYKNLEIKCIFLLFIMSPFSIIFLNLPLF